MSEVEIERKDLAKKWSRNKAVATMAAGCALFLIAVLVPAKIGTALQYSMIAVGAVGLVVLAVGAYYRPMKAEPKE